MLNEKRVEIDIAQTQVADQGTKLIYFADKNLRLIEAQLWIIGTETTALTVAIESNDFLDAGIPVELGTIASGTGDQSGNIKVLDLAGQEILAGTAFNVTVKSGTTADKACKVVVRFLEDEALPGSIAS